MWKNLSQRDYKQQLGADSPVRQAEISRQGLGGKEDSQVLGMAVVAPAIHAPGMLPKEAGANTPRAGFVPMNSLHGAEWHPMHQLLPQQRGLPRKAGESCHCLR